MDFLHTFSQVPVLVAQILTDHNEEGDVADFPSQPWLVALTQQITTTSFAVTLESGETSKARTQKKITLRVWKEPKKLFTKLFFFNDFFMLFFYDLVMI